MISRRTLLVALLVLCTAFVACRKTANIITPENTIPETPGHKLTMAEVEAAIIRGGNDRKWTMSKEAPGRITATTIVHGKHSITVDVNYTQTSFEIKYRDSSNMNSDGVRIHPHYNDWVMNLSNSITREINIAQDSKK